MEDGGTEAELRNGTDALWGVGGGVIGVPVRIGLIHPNVADVDDSVWREEEGTREEPKGLADELKKKVLMELRERCGRTCRRTSPPPLSASSNVPTAPSSLRSASAARDSEKPRWALFASDTRTPARGPPLSEKMRPRRTEKRL